jgi:hypothetical protein
MASAGGGAPDSTLLAVADELADELNNGGLPAIDEWLEARGIDPIEMHAFIGRWAGGRGAAGFYVQVGYELAARKYAADRPG